MMSIKALRSSVRHIARRSSGLSKGGLSRLMTRCRGEPNDRSRSKDAFPPEVERSTSMIICADWPCQPPASVSRNAPGAMMRSFPGDSGAGTDHRAWGVVLLKLLSVRVKAASDPAWPIIFDPGLGSFYAGKPVKLLLRAVRPCHNDETDAGLRWKNFEGGLMFDCCHFHNFSNHPTN
jgi:hypothetical protein